MSWIMFGFALIGMYATYEYGSDRWGRRFDIPWFIFAAALWVLAMMEAF